MGREFEHPLSEFGSLLSDNMEIVGKNNDSVAIAITINRVVLFIQSIRSSTILNSNSLPLYKKMTCIWSQQLARLCFRKNNK